MSHFLEIKSYFCSVVIAIADASIFLNSPVESTVITISV